MQTIVQLILTTLQIGAVYILFALGLTLIFGVMRIVNFAHGQFFTMSALLVAIALPALTSKGFSAPVAYLLAMLIGVTAATFAGVLVYQFGFRRFQRDLTGSFILSAGVVLLFEGTFLHVFGGAVRAVPPIVDGNVTVFGASLTAQRLVLCLAAVALTVTLYWALSATRFGKAMRAVSIDHEAAMLQGIPYKSIAFRGFLVATVIGAVAGALIAPVTAVTPTLGDSYLVKGFIAVIIGGLGSVVGAIVGSLFIALVETVGGYFYDPSLASLAIFVLVMVVLLARPRGLLGNG